MKSVDGGNEGGIAFGGRGVSDTHTHKTLIFFFYYLHQRTRDMGVRYLRSRRDDIKKKAVN